MAITPMITAHLIISFYPPKDEANGMRPMRPKSYLSYTRVRVMLTIACIGMRATSAPARWNTQSLPSRS